MQAFVASLHLLIGCADVGTQLTNMVSSTRLQTSFDASCSVGWEVERIVASRIIATLRLDKTVEAQTILQECGRRLSPLCANSFVAHALITDRFLAA